MTFLSLVAGVGHFAIVGKNFSQSHLIIIRKSPRNNITHILHYFNNFSVIPFI